MGLSSREWAPGPGHVVDTALVFAPPRLHACVSGADRLGVWQCIFMESPPPKGLIGCIFFLARCVADQTDGESEEEQESAGTGEEDEDGDESDLVTPALRSHLCVVAE